MKIEKSQELHKSISKQRLGKRNPQVIYNHELENPNNTNLIFTKQHYKVKII